MATATKTHFLLFIHMNFTLKPWYTHSNCFHVMHQGLTEISSCRWYLMIFNKRTVFLLHCTMDSICWWKSLLTPSLLFHVFPIWQPCIKIYVYKAFIFGKIVRFMFSQLLICSNSNLRECLRMQLMNCYLNIVYLHVWIVENHYDAGCFELFNDV